jgi:EmrB/QacA subfamily drug resistance transporter
MGCYGFGAIVAPAVGPVLGGYLVDYANWRFVFYINGPLGLLGAIAAYFLVPKIAKVTAHRFDFTGFAVAALGLFAILLAASEGESWGWTGYRILGLLVFGVLCLALFVVIEMEVEHPLIDLRILKIGPYTLSISLVGVFFINILSTSFYIPVFLQVGQGKEAFVAGILMIPQAVVTFMMMPLSGLLYDKIGARWLATGGLVLCAYGTYLLAGMSADMTRENLLIWSCIRATGLGMAIMPIMTAAMAAVPPELSNQASALLNVFQQVAGALGLAALGALATGQGAQLLADRAALIRPNPAMPDLSGQLSPETFTLAYRFGERLQAQVLGTAYANLFVVLTVLTLVCAFFALFLGSGAPTAAASRSEVAGAADADPDDDARAADVEAVEDEGVLLRL